MRKTICFLICLLLSAALTAPFAVCAETYKPNGTDVAITVDDTSWYVFTPDNLDNNPDLAELGASAEQMRKVFEMNDAFFDAFTIYDDGSFLELIAIKKKVDVGVANLADYGDDEVLELAKEVSGLQGIDDYSVYKKNGYKFVKLEAVSTAPDNITYNLCEYFTVVNKDIYSFKFQSTTEFTSDQYDVIAGIIDGVKFNVDESLKEGKKGGVLTGTLIGAAGGAAVGAVIALISKASAKKKKSAADVSGYGATVLNGVPYADGTGPVKPEGYVESDGPVKPDGSVESGGFADPNDQRKE